MSHKGISSISNAVDLSTTYLGFELPHPFMPGSSPLADTLDNVRRFEDAGAAMIVLRSLFAEQISHDNVEDIAHPFRFMPEAEDFVFSPDESLLSDRSRQVRAGLLHAGDSTLENVIIVRS
jgi:dihydroorotate dehydrogenase (fumarate)